MDVTPPPLRDGNVYRWLGGLALSLVADQVYFVAFAWATVRSVEPAMVGVVIGAGALPRALLMLLGGVLVDRWSPKAVIIVSNLGRTAVMFAGAAAAFLTSSGLTLPALIAVALLFGAIDAMFWPAADSLPPRVVERQHLVRLQGVRSITYRGAAILGAPLGAILLTVVPVGGVFLAVGATTLLSALVMATVKLRVVSGEPASTESVARALAEGVRYVISRPLTRSVLLVAAVVEVAFTGVFNVGVPLLANARDWGPDGIGWVMGGFGIGAGCSALLLIVLGTIPRAGAALIASIGVQAAALGAFTLTDSLAICTAAAAIVGICSGLIGGVIGSLLQTTTPVRYLGRAMSLMNLVSFGLTPIAYVATGLISSQIGIAATFLGAAIVTGAATVVAVASKTLRAAQLPAITTVDDEPPVAETTSTISPRP
ncbi:MFS transporter [Kribbella endophytica]